MPYLFYSDEKSEPFTGSLANINATRCYLRHYDNYLVLNFIILNTKDRTEKQQAVKEISVCERKMKWAKNQPSYNKEEADVGAYELKKKWR